jgi:hypothetical protein
MENSSARPYFAIFAVVAIVVAGFMLKQQFATASLTPDQIEQKSPRRMLVETKSGRIPESIPDWFKRVGWKDLGFVSEQQMTITQGIVSSGRKSPDLTKEELDTIRDLVASEGITKDLGIQALTRIQKPEDRKAFLPVVKSLYADGAPNQAFRTLVSGWYRSGDADLIKTFEKDPNPKLRQFVRRIIDDIEYPGKGV